MVFASSWLRLKCLYINRSKVDFFNRMGDWALWRESTEKNDACRTIVLLAGIVLLRQKSWEILDVRKLDLGEEVATFTQAAGNVLMGSIVLMDWNRSHGLESFSWNGIVLMDWTFSWDLEMLPVFPDIGPLDFWISLSFCICRQFGGSSSCFPVALCHGRCGCCAVCARDSMWWNWDIERGNRFDKTWSVAPALEGLRGLQPFLKISAC